MTALLEYLDLLHHFHIKNYLTMQIKQIAVLNFQEKLK